MTVSRKFQVVIPLEVRRALDTRPGQKIEVVAYEGRLEFIPVDRPGKLRGCLRGIDTAVPREADRT